MPESASVIAVSVRDENPRRRGNRAELDGVDDDCDTGGSDHQTVKPGDLIAVRSPFPPTKSQASESRLSARKSHPSVPYSRSVESD